MIDVLYSVVFSGLREWRRLRKTCTRMTVSPNTHTSTARTCSSKHHPLSSVHLITYLLFLIPQSIPLISLSIIPYSVFPYFLYLFVLNPKLGLLESLFNFPHSLLHIFSTPYPLFLMTLPHISLSLLPHFLSFIPLVIARCSILIPCS